MAARPIPKMQEAWLWLSEEIEKTWIWRKRIPYRLTRLSASCRAKTHLHDACLCGQCGPLATSAWLGQQALACWRVISLIDCSRGKCLLMGQLIFCGIRGIS